MSVLLYRNQLQESDVKKIREDLQIKAINGYPGSPFYNVNIFDFYHYIQETGQLYVPRWYGLTFYSSLITEKKYPTTVYRFNGELFPQQLEDGKKAIDYANSEETKGGVILNLYPGYGKTVLGAWMAQVLGLVTLVIYPRTILEPSWGKTFKDYTTAKVEIVDKDMKTEGADVYLSMDTKIPFLNRKIADKIGILIIDEGHMLCTPSRVQCLLAIQPKYIIVETATLEREDKAERMIYLMTSTQRIHRPMTKQFDVYKVRFDIKIPDVKTKTSHGKSYMDWNDLINKMYANDEYNARVLDLVLRNLGFKIMILTQRVSHAQKLAEMLTHLKVDACSYTGKNKNYKDSKVLITTINKSGTGMDQAMCAKEYDGVRINLLIWLASTKKVQVLEQSFGRVLRANHPVVMYVMINHGSLTNHYKIAKRWLKNLNAKIIE